MAAALLPALMPCIMLVQKNMQQWEMKERLEAENLHTIRVKTGSVQWTLLGNECSINGKMFDVKEAREEGDFLILTGLFDEEETDINEAIARSGDADEEELGNLIHHMSNTVAEPWPNQHWALCAGAGLIHGVPAFSTAINSPAAMIPSPPPKGDLV